MISINGWEAGETLQTPGEGNTPSWISALILPYCWKRQRTLGKFPQSPPLTYKRLEENHQGQSNKLHPNEDCLSIKDVLKLLLRGQSQIF